MLKKQFIIQILNSTYIKINISSDNAGFFLNGNPRVAPYKCKQGLMPLGISYGDFFSQYSESLNLWPFIFD